MSGAFPDRAEIDPVTKQVVYSTPDPNVRVGDSRDARNRALRTFVMNLLTDLLVVAVLFLFPVFSSADFDWSGTDWKVLALSFAKTIVVTVLSYVARVMRISLPTTTA